MSIADLKLKQARQEMEAICAKYDIAGFFVLHNAPGSSEHWLCLSPSYSRARMEGLGAVRIQSKRADYPNAAEQAKDLAATANMVSSLATTAAAGALPMLDLAKQLDGIVGATHIDLGFEPTPPKGAH